MRSFDRICSVSTSRGLNSPRQPLARVHGALLSAILLLGGCWVQNGSYCQSNSDCQKGLCIGYERGVKAGLCTESLALSSKVCRLNETFQDGMGSNRSFGQSVQIMIDKKNPQIIHALIGHSQGFSYCKNDQTGLVTDIRKQNASRIPYGPSTRLPRSSSSTSWISSEPSSNQVIDISTGNPVEGAEFANIKSPITSVAASPSWVAMSDVNARTVWLWKESEFDANASFGSDFEDPAPGFGKTLALSNRHIAIGSDAAVSLYDIDTASKMLTNRNLSRPSAAGNSFGSAITLSTLGLAVSEQIESSAGTKIWWYPIDKTEAQELPVPIRYQQNKTEAIIGYGASLASTDSRIAIGVPGDGGVVMLERANNDWQEISVAKPEITKPERSRFGAALAMDNDWIAVGAPGESRVYLYLCN